jgi:hypothetical protein
LLLSTLDTLIAVWFWSLKDRKSSYVLFGSFVVQIGSPYVISNDPFASASSAGPFIWLIVSKALSH